MTKLARENPDAGARDRPVDGTAMAAPQDLTLIVYFAQEKRFGSVTVHDADEAMDDILEQIRRVFALVGEISKASTALSLRLTPFRA